MLSLPPEWQTITGGAVVTHLLGMVSENASQLKMASHLIGVCLDLAAEEISLRTPSPLVVESLPNFCWRIGDYTYVYFHDINDKSLARAIELGSRFFGSIIVPSGCEEILWRACQAILGNQTPSILALDFLVNLRTLFTSEEYHWSHQRVVFEILCRYNRRVLDATGDETILIDIPPACPCSP
jgi:hypothetical protein